MNWETLLKANFLPKRNNKRWLQILETQQATDAFIRQIQSGDFQTKGMEQTLQFIEGDNFDSLLGSLIGEGIDETDAEARYETVRVVLRQALQKHTRSQRAMVNVEEFTETLDKIARAIRGNRREKIGGLLKAAEIFARNHPKIVRRVKGDMRREHGTTLIPFLNQHDEITNPGANAQKMQDLTGLKPLSQQEQERTERALARRQKGDTNPVEASKTHTYEYALLGMFAAMGRTKGRPMKEKELRALAKLKVNEVTLEDAERYLKEVAVLHRSLVPDDWLPSTSAGGGGRGLMQVTGKKYRLNPYLEIILEKETLELAQANLNTSLIDSVGGDRDKLRRLLQHNERIYPDTFAEWIQLIEFENNKIKVTMDEDTVYFGKETYEEEEQSRLERLNEYHFKEVETGYSRLDTSQDMADLVEQVWNDMLNSKLDRTIPGILNEEKIVEELRESEGNFDTIMANYTEGEPPDTFGRSSKELLDVIVAGAESVGLELEEPSKDAFVELYDGFKAKIDSVVESKLQDIVANPPKYIGFSVGREKENIYEMLQREGYLS